MAADADGPTRSSERLRRGRVAVGHHARGIAVVTMRGEHDLSTQPEVADALAQAAAHSNVVVDLSECSFIDSTVIQELVKTSHAVSAKGEQVILVIPRKQAAVARIADVTGLAQIFELHPTTDAALASLETGPRPDARLS
jgi:anti-sigma B factor antagonist